MELFNEVTEVDREIERQTDGDKISIVARLRPVQLTFV
jgi:hypothetical protein